MEAIFVMAADQAEDVDADLAPPETTAVELSLDEFMKKTDVSTIRQTLDRSWVYARLCTIGPRASAQMWHGDATFEPHRATFEPRPEYMCRHSASTQGNLVNPSKTISDAAAYGLIVALTRDACRSVPSCRAEPFFLARRKSARNGTRYVIRLNRFSFLTKIQAMLALFDNFGAASLLRRYDSIPRFRRATGAASANTRLSGSTARRHADPRRKPSQDQEVQVPQR